MEDYFGVNSKKRDKDRDLTSLILESLLKYDILTKSELIRTLKIEPSRSSYNRINIPLENLQKMQVIEITERSKKMEYLSLMEKRKCNPDRYGPLLKLLNKSPSKVKKPDKEQKEETRGGGSQICCKIVKSINTIQSIHSNYPNDLQLQKHLLDSDWVRNLILSDRFEFVSEVLCPVVKDALSKIPSFFTYAITLPRPDDAALELLSIVTEEYPDITDLSKERLTVGEIAGERQLYTLLSILGYYDLKKGFVTEKTLLNILQPIQNHLHEESVFSKEYEQMNTAMVSIANLHHLVHRGEFLLAVPDDFGYICSILPFLSKNADPISEYINNRLSPETLELFDEFQNKHSIKNKLVDAVTQDVNTALKDPLLLENLNIQFDPETRDYLDRLTSTNDIVHRNRLVVEYGYQYFQLVPSLQTSLLNKLNALEQMVLKDNQLRINYMRSKDETILRGIMEDRLVNFKDLRKMLTKNWV